MSSQTNQTIPPITMWIWPTGLYPRRMVYYLKARSLSREIANNITLVPVSINKEAGTLLAQPNHEARPAGTSLPALRIDGYNDNNNTTTTTIIHQSSSILIYLEEILGPQYSGHDPAHRAHVADIVQHVNEALVWSNVYLRHKFDWTRAWTGMTREEQSSSTAADALKEWRRFMGKLEDWVREDVVSRKSASIAGRGRGRANRGTRGDGGGEVGDDGPTLADFTLMAAATYLMEMYDWDVFEGCEVLKEWYQRAMGCAWFVDKQGLERIERDGFEELFKD